MVYDLAGQRTALITPISTRWTMLFDEAGRRRAEINPLSQRTSFTLDKAGQAVAVKDANANVTSSVELEACKAGGITRVQGPAVTELMDKPVAAAEGAPLAQAQNAA